MSRPYESMLDHVRPFPDRDTAMQTFVDLLWPALHPTGISWLGFYLHTGNDELILGPRRDKPACSPIGLHGACGQAFLQRKTLIVRDVADLGANYVACDPRDKSEIVVPLINQDGSCWGVFDVDSWDIGAFTDADETGLTRLLRRAGLTCD
ncbi:MAG: GAF domain-containing protein [Planctomycetota bacterium]